jgi:hypothetical protein
MREASGGGEAKRRSSGAQCKNQSMKEQGSAKVARGKRADAKRRRSGAQHINQATTEQEMAKVSRGRQVAAELRGGAAAWDATTNQQRSRD